MCSVLKAAQQQQQVHAMSHSELYATVTLSQVESHGPIAGQHVVLEAHGTIAEQLRGARECSY